MSRANVSAAPPSPAWGNLAIPAASARQDGHENGTINRPIPMEASVTSQNHHMNRTTDADVYKVGIYGWRKRCLYFFILVLTVIILINLALTIWIFKVLNFNMEGMGNMRITKDGIRVEGQSEFHNPVYFKKIEGLQNSPLEIVSDRSVAISARNSSGDITGRLFIGNNHVQAMCDRFEVFNIKEELLFSTDKNEIAVKVDNLRIMGTGGTKFEGSVQTELVRPEPGSPLRLESPTHGLYVEAAQDVEILSRAGDITAKALLDVNIEAKRELRLTGKNIYFDSLSQSDGYGEPQFQVCVCKDGRLFLANNGADCRASRKICKS